MERERTFRIVEKTVTVDRPIADLLCEAIYEYRNKWRDVPDGLLVGPSQWIALKHYMLRSCQFPGEEYLEHPRFHGVPVYRMRRPGVDVCPSDSVAHYMAVGTVKEKEL